MNSISLAFNTPFDVLIKNLYLDQKFSAQEISDYIVKEKNILITTRSIQRQLKKLGLTRGLSDAFNLAIKNGRKSYEHLKKPIKASLLRRGINLKLRYEILQRDGSRCVICGKTTKDDILVVDHIVPVVRGGTNSPNNLQTLCRACNHGKMILSERI
ncbi:MAG: hypothetical protein ACD_72C00479G0003 [uncultured bacterium]|nr:MAG: hypothetical protein ACD_72C00479G0003 [uncultured bacterium]